jgi:hypothetical protein
VIPGVIWRGDHADWLWPVEAGYWRFHILPFGWTIISEPTL